ncbi:MAG: DUF169 domain-containing protein [Myxococcales bacterium]|nr:DUF169 domain-containing protein [Myxococcales bacterium]
MTHWAEISRRFQDELLLPLKPLALYYAAEKPADALGYEGIGRGKCIVSLVYRAARKNCAAAFDLANHGCPGAGLYLGYRKMSERPDLHYFLSCGIAGKMEGERYIKTPELARVRLDGMPSFAAPAPYCIFQPLEQIPAGTEPLAVIFLVPPDILSALVILADFANPENESNTAVHFASGCGHLVAWPIAEAARPHPRAVLGMFDISARPTVPPEVLSYTIPAALLREMAANLDESFLTTDSWKIVKRRLARQEKTAEL